MPLTKLSFAVHSERLSSVYETALLTLCSLNRLRIFSQLTDLMKSIHYSIHFKILFLAISFFIKEVAAETDLDKPMPLEDYLRYAQANNPELHIFEQRYEAARERIPQMRSLPDPRLEITHFVESVETRTGPQENVIKLSQTFPWFNKLDRREAVSSAEAEALWFAYKGQQLTLAREVATIFYEYGYLGKTIELTGKNLDLLRKLEPIVSERVRAGADLNTLLRLQVEMGKIEDRLHTLEQARFSQNARFAALLNHKTDTLLPWPIWDARRIQNLDGGSLEQALISNNPELQMLDRQIESQTARVALAKLESYPDITLGVNYIQTGSAVSPNTRDSGKDPWGIMLGLNLPIWVDKNRAARREIRAHKNAIERQRQHRENQLRAELSTALAELENANRQLELYGEDLLDKAQQAVEISQASYENSRAGIFEVIDSERSLLELRMLYWRAAADVWQNHIYIQTLVNQTLY